MVVFLATFFVILLLSILSTFIVTFNDVYLNVACALDLGVVYYTSTFFTALVLFDTVGRLLLLHVGRLYTFLQYTINLEAVRRDHLSSIMTF